ncbi:hypothetical protein ACT7DH_13205 [Bacillus pacificus]
MKQLLHNPQVTEIIRTWAMLGVKGNLIVRNIINLCNVQGFDELSLDFIPLTETSYLSRI